MLAIRAVLAVALIVAGIVILYNMLHYPIAQSFTGLVLGAAMVALGIFRLVQIARVRQTR